MVTNTRNFLQTFTAIRAKACNGKTIRVQDKKREFLFTTTTPHKSLLGAAKGEITFHADLTKPTLVDENHFSSRKLATSRMRKS